jgi:hypothetical protein
MPHDHGFKVLPQDHQGARPIDVAGFEEPLQVGLEPRLPRGVQGREGLVGGA